MFEVVEGKYKMPPLPQTRDHNYWAFQHNEIYIRTANLAVQESDINQHLSYLHRCAQDYRHITEFGVRQGVSTTALLAGLSHTAMFNQGEGILHSYDINQSSEVEKLQKLAGPMFEFHHQSTLEAVIEPTELLFIDTYHTYAQLKLELDKHANKVWHRMVFHDTVTFGEVGEDGGRPGLMQAINELIEQGEWVQTFHFQYNNGLLVLDRKPETKQRWIDHHGQTFLLRYGAANS